MAKKRTYRSKHWLPNTNRGFTLIELMIASMILSIIISAVYYTYRTAMDSYQRAQNQAELFQNAQASVESLGNDLRGAFKQFVATKGKLDIVTSFNRSHPPDKDYGFTEVKYYYADGLTREEEPLVQGEVEVKPVPEMIAPWVSKIEFDYSDGQSWYDSWDSSILKSMPAAVRVTLEITGQDPKYPQHNKFSTIIPVFAGMKY